MMDRRGFLSMVSGMAAAVGLSKFMPVIEATQEEAVAVCDPICRHVLVAVQNAIVGPEPRTVIQLEPFLEDSFALNRLWLQAENPASSVPTFLSLDIQRRRASTFPVALLGYEAALKVPLGLRAWQAGSAKDQRKLSIFQDSMHPLNGYVLVPTPWGQFILTPPSFVGLVVQSSEPGKVYAGMVLRRILKPEEEELRRQRRETAVEPDDAEDDDWDSELE